MAITITLPDDKIAFKRSEFTEREEDLLMRPGGVYAFYGENGECLYVGQSKRLANRLRNHFAASPFSAQIERIDIYFAENPYEREIYETFAITALGGRYNKAKNYPAMAANPLIREEMDDILFEIDALDAERATLEEDLRQIELILHPPIPQKFNNVTGDISERYDEYMTTHRIEMEDDRFAEDESEYRRICDRLAEIEEEKDELKDKYLRFRRKLEI